MMAGAVLAVNLLLLAATLLGEPAPREVGRWEVMLSAGVVAATALLAVRLLRRRPLHPGPSTRVAMLATACFAIPVIGSILVGALRGVPFDTAFRSALPYLAFMPVALLGTICEDERAARWTVRAMIAIGVVQAVYLLALYAAGPIDLLNPRAVRLARTTLFDPRTTVPLILGAVALPLGELAAARSRVARAGWIVVSLTAFVGIASTQTRAHLLAAIFSVGTFLLLAAARRAVLAGQAATRGLGRGAAAFTLLVAVASIAVVAIPYSRSLASAIVLRLQERDNNRVVDEWTPAFGAMMDAGAAGVLAGVGSGESFVTASGDQRTYVHNLVIYAALYYGVPGAGLILLAYLLLVVGLVRRGLRGGGPRFLALAALTVALLVYAQFFAVHKLLSYNLMLALVLQVALLPGPEAPSVSAPA